MTQLTCTCAQTRLEVHGTPIIRAECHCDSCRTAGERLRTLPSVPAFMDANGGTPYVLHRKDHVRVVQGVENLREFRLTASAPTRRVVATCCNTPVFLEFDRGHWLSLYSSLWPPDLRPRPQLRTMTSDLPAGSPLPDDIPNSRTQSFGFMVKLLGAWIAMGFRAPRFEGGEVALEFPG